jgi:ankyrin repeat protein
MGADIYAVDKRGINMFHVAAQGDQAYSLAFFREKGMSIFATDNEQSTPLHWACVSGSDTAIYYLLAWGADVLAQDNDGNTPLHLAVMKANEFPNTRAIKELLIKGADRESTEVYGRTPIEMTEGLPDEKLKKEIHDILSQKPSKYACCHLKQPLQKITPSYKTASIFIGLIFGSYLLLMAFTFPYL